MNDDLDAMRRHVDALCYQHNITVKTVTPGNESSCRAERTISALPITGVMSYMTALHEIAHVVARGTAYSDKLNGRPYRQSVLHAEEEAWRWAVKHARVRIPHWVWMRIAIALTGYKGWTGARHPEEKAS